MADGHIENLEERLDEHLSSAHPRRYATSDEPTSDPGVLRDEQFREADEIAGGPGIPVMTGPMGRGMVGGGAIGAVVGALVLLPFGFIPFASLDVGARLLVLAICGAVAGATAGAVYFGARVPELSGESVDADNRPSAGSTLDDPRTDDRGR